MQTTDVEILKGLISLIKVNNGKFSDDDIKLLKGINKIINERWITIHPHGDDSEDYRRVKLEDGETPKEAIDRVYRKRNTNKSQDFLKRIKSVDINKLSLEELEELKENAKEIVHSNGISFEDRVNLQEKIFNINMAVNRFAVKLKADKVGGYTKKLNDLCGFTQFSDISSYPIELQKHIYDNYKIVYSKYPQVRYGGLQIKSLSDITYANNLSRSNIITLNSKKYSDLNALKKSYAETVKMQFHPQGTDYNSIIVHELGHGLQQYIERKYKITGVEIRASVLKKIGIKQKEVGNHLSVYAMKKPREAHEFFAEAFAEYMTSTKPRPLAVEFGKEINGILNQK